MGLVTNAGWIDGNATDGLRRCLAEEFSDIYVFHLRGNARSSGALRQREGGNIFNQGSRAPIAISLLVKNANACRRGRIFFHDIGDYLSRDEKLKVVTDFGSINKLTQQNAWSQIAPDEHGDWLKQRAGGFDEFIKIGDKENKNTLSLFENYSGGVKTNRDAWCFNHSKAKVAENVEASIAFLNAEVDRYARAVKAGVVTEAKDFINRDPTRLNWDRTEVQGVERGRKVEFDSQSIVKSLYRPFSRQWL